MNSAVVHRVNNAVCFRVYKIYQQMFVDSFGLVCTSDSKQNSEQKQLMKFGWTLFLILRSQRKYTDANFDALYHLILICFEFVYVSCINSDRGNLVKELYSDNIRSKSDFRSSHPICMKYGGTASEIASIKRWFLNFLNESLFKPKVLQTSGENLFHFLRNDLMQINVIELDKFYTSLISKNSYFDGRKYLGNKINLGENEISEESNVLRQNLFNNVLSPNIRTPLSGRTYLNTKRQDYSKSNKKEITSHRFIFRLISENTPYPSKRFVELIQSHDDCLIKEMIAKVDEMTSTLSKRLQQIDSALSPQFPTAVKTLFYKMLASIMNRELKIKKDPSCLNILTQDVFHYTLFVCCADILVYLYKAKPVFLQLLAIFKIHGFHFFKIMEIIVRTERDLPCSTIKHLQTIEEHVLDKISWESTSPLWSNLKQLTDIPNSIDVALPHEGIEFNFKSLTKSRDITRESFQGASHRNLSDKIKDDSKKKDPLFFFFKKFYYLAAIRATDLLDKLNVMDMEIRRKMWTVFEYVITQKTEIMRDRHLDQILLCTIYAVIKKSSIDRSFSDIINCYRLQPQANSTIFRNVLIFPSDSEKHEVRSDIIIFYNDIFVVSISTFMKNFSTEVNQQRLKLSPMPLACPISPAPSHRISEQHLVYIRSLDNSLIPSPNSPTFKHYFYKSPSKNLEIINNVLRSKDLKRKKNTVDEEMIIDYGDKNKKNSNRLSNSLYDLIEERCE